ncbi:MAG: hypothetical protein NZM11_10375, partial [Anaerolineales bacterium]|nr:hypothetical protein [Anaerolineales bacterium]
MKPGWLRVLPPSLQARLEGRLNLQKILVNTGWLFGDRILRLGVGLVVGIWVTRHLAAAGSILAVHIWAAVFVFLGVAQSSWDVAEGLMR